MQSLHQHNLFYSVAEKVMSFRNELQQEERLSKNMKRRPHRTGHQ